MPTDSTSERFLSALGRCLLSLPFDLKILLEAIADPEFERREKEISAGAILYVLAPNDAVPPDHRHLGYADDVVLVRLVFRHLRDHGGEGAAGFTSRFPEVYATLDDDLESFAGYLGEPFKWIEGKVEGLPRQVYRGKNVRKYLDDAEAAGFLYDKGVSFLTDYEIDDEVVSRMKRADLVKQHLERRMHEGGRAG
jgi:uncharacterized membrane protein YkvA (DUF1232 family)